MKRDISFKELEQLEPELKKRTIRVEGWRNKEVVVTESSALEMQDLLLKTRKYTDDQNVQKMALVISKCVKDKTGGSPSFEWLVRQSFGSLVFVSNIVNELNGIGAASTENLEKNSETPSGDISSI